MPQNNVLPFRRTSQRNCTLVTGVIAGSIVIGAIIGTVGSLVGSKAQAGERVDFSFCHTGGGTNCVVDGDTIWFRGEKIRIADIDAPETHVFQCAAEKELGDRATMRLHALLESGSITLRSLHRDQDRYGRKLRKVIVGEQNVGSILIQEGLARPYTGGPRGAWC